MLSLKALLSAIAVASFASAQASSANSPTLQLFADTLGVKASDLLDLEKTSDLSTLDLKEWSSVFQHDPEVLGDHEKITYLEAIKSQLEELLESENALDKPALSKRRLGSDDPKARAQVSAAIANGQATRDSSNRRKLLQCEQRTQKKCTTCAQICSAKWVASTAVCGGAALGAEAASAGGLTAPIGIALTGCVGLAGANYAGCIQDCINKPN
ncbi:hypothetical protein ACHAPJ_009314 [Fusarium lateritium]